MSITMPTMKAPLVFLFLILSLPFSLFLSGCEKSTEMSLEQQDYSLARTHFTTHLIQQGPAPQPHEPILAPAGTTLIPYTKTLPLQAIIGPIPSDGKKHPAILFLHGGFAADASDWEATEPFRKAGYVVMMPILRGEDGQPGNYSMFYGELSDVLAASEKLAALPYVDSKHLYVAGHSVGGTLTLLAALSSKQFRAAASFSGSCDQIVWSSGQTEPIPFDPNDKREFQMRSPIAFATSFKCPTRIYYGSKEGMFATMSQETARRAKSKNLDVATEAVPGDHMSAVEGEIEKAIAFFQANQ